MTIETETKSSIGLADLQPLSAIRSSMNEILDSLSDEQMIHPPVEGGNHALWTMGHLAFADQFFLIQLGGFEPTLPEDWGKKFGWGHPCAPNATDFPSVAEVRAAMDQQRVKLTDWFNSLTADELDASTGPDWEEFAPTRRALIAGLAVHEGCHFGQVTVIRKSLQLPPLSM